MHLGTTSNEAAIVPSFSDSGVTVRYDDTGDGEAVILLHCAGTSRRQWKYLTDKLAPEYRVIAPDMIGFGASDPWPHDTLGLDQEARIIGRLLDLFDGPAHLAGHSFGATIGLRLARLHPARFASLTLFEPIPFGMLDYAGESELFAEISAMGERFLERFEDEGPRAGAEVFGQYWLGKAGWEKLPEPARRAIAEGAAMLRLEILAKLADTARFKDFGALAVSTLFVNGRSSQPIGRRIAELFVAAMPQARRCAVPGNHMAPVSDPGPFARVVIDHIARRQTDFT